MNTSTLMDKQITDLSRTETDYPTTTATTNTDLSDVMMTHHHHDDEINLGSSPPLDLDINNKDDILPSYDFHPISRSIDSTISNSAPRVPDLKPHSAPLKSYGSVDSSKPSKILMDNAQKANDSAIVSEIDQALKKHTDNILHAIDSLSARLSKLENTTRDLEYSVDDLKVSVGNSYGLSDGKMRQLENMLSEVQTGVQYIKDKQDVMEGYVQLAKLQNSKVEKSPEAPNAMHVGEPIQPSAVSAPQQQPNIPSFSNPVPQPSPPSFPNPVPQSAPSFAGPVPQSAPSFAGPVPQSAPSFAGPVPQPAPSFPNPVPQSAPSFPNPISQSPPSFPNHVPQPAPSFADPVAQPALSFPPTSVPQKNIHPVPQPHHSASMPPYPQPQHPQQQLPQFVAPPLGHHPEETPFMPPHTYSHNVHQPGPQPSGGSPQAHQYYNSQPTMYGPPPSGRPSSEFLDYGPPSGSRESYPYGSGSTTNPHPRSPRSGGGNRYPQIPTARIVPQAIPTATNLGSGSSTGSGGGNRVPVDDLVDKVANMGFPRDHVRATVRRLTEDGQSVDLNIVLDKLMNDGDVPPPKGWFGR